VRDTAEKINTRLAWRSKVLIRGFEESSSGEETKGDVAAMAE